MSTAFESADRWGGMFLRKLFKRGKKNKDVFFSVNELEFIARNKIHHRTLTHKVS